MSSDSDSLEERVFLKQENDLIKPQLYEPYSVAISDLYPVENILSCEGGVQTRESEAISAEIPPRIHLREFEAKSTPKPSDSFPPVFMSNALIDKIESELKIAELAHARTLIHLSSQPAPMNNNICEHGGIRMTCKMCSGKDLCLHGKVRYYCKDCGGKYICSHGRRKYECGDCGGQAFCSHGRRKSRCKECGGCSICPHGRRKWYCIDCGGSSICSHGRQKYRCKECKRDLQSSKPSAPDNLVNKNALGKRDVQSISKNSPTDF